MREAETSASLFSKIEYMKKYIKFLILFSLVPTTASFYFLQKYKENYEKRTHQKRNPKLNKKKAKQVILYFLNKCGGMTFEKLTYLLYFAEFDYYEKFEKHLCGFTFLKTKNGIKMQ